MPVYVNRVQADQPATGVIAWAWPTAKSLTRIRQEAADTTKANRPLWRGRVLVILDTGNMPTGGAHKPPVHFIWPKQALALLVPFLGGAWGGERLLVGPTLVFWGKSTLSSSW